MIYVIPHEVNCTTTEKGFFFQGIGGMFEKPLFQNHLQFFIETYCKIIKFQYKRIILFRSRLLSL